MKFILLFSLLIASCSLMLFAQDTTGDIKQNERDTPVEAEAEVQYELHRRLDTLDQGKEFSAMSRTKSTIRNDVITLDRLLREKDGELTRMNARLEKNYPVDLSKDYRFDLESRVLYQINPGEGEGAKKTEEKVIAFEDEARQQVFVRLLTSKRLTQVTISSLKLLLREKRLELKGVNDRLLEKFGILSDRNYLYHAKSNVVFLIKQKQP